MGLELGQGCVHSKINATRGANAKLPLAKEQGIQLVTQECQSSSGCGPAQSCANAQGSELFWAVRVFVEGTKIGGGEVGPSASGDLPVEDQLK